MRPRKTPHPCPTATPPFPRLPRLHLAVLVELAWWTVDQSLARMVRSVGSRGRDSLHRHPHRPSIPSGSPMLLFPDRHPPYPLFLLSLLVRLLPNRILAMNRSKLAHDDLPPTPPSPPPHRAIPPNRTPSDRPCVNNISYAIQNAFLPLPFRFFCFIALHPRTIMITPQHSQRRWTIRTVFSYLFHPEVHTPLLLHALLLDG